MSEAPLADLLPDRFDALEGGADGAGSGSTPPEDPPAPTAENVLDSALLEGILESLLLAAGAPVPMSRLVDTLDGPGRAEVARALRDLGARYEREGRGMRLVHVAGGFQLRSAPQHGPFVRRLLGGKPPRLSRPMLETLAIVAYRQPCTRPEIEAIRGVDCGAAIGSLLERRLVRIEGRKEAPGRPLLYGTTKDFLEVFGLPDVQALPPLRELGDGAQLLMEEDLTVAADGVRATAASAPPGTDGLDAAPENAGPTGGTAGATIPAVEMATTSAVAAPAAAERTEGDEPAADEPAADDGPAPRHATDVGPGNEALAGDPPGDGVGVAAGDVTVG